MKNDIVVIQSAKTLVLALNTDTGLDTQKAWELKDGVKALIEDTWTEVGGTYHRMDTKEECLVDVLLTMFDLDEEDEEYNIYEFETIDPIFEKDAFTKQELVAVLVGSLSLGEEQQ